MGMVPTMLLIVVLLVWKCWRYGRDRKALIVTWRPNPSEKEEPPKRMFLGKALWHCCGMKTNLSIYFESLWGVDFLFVPLWQQAVDFAELTLLNWLYWIDFAELTLLSWLCLTNFAECLSLPSSRQAAVGWRRKARLRSSTTQLPYTLL